MRHVMDRRAGGLFALPLLIAGTLMSAPVAASPARTSNETTLAQATTASPKDAQQPTATPQKVPAPATPAPAKPATSTTTPSAPPPAPTTPGDQSPTAPPSTKTPGAAPAPQKLAPDTKPDQTEVEPNGSPGVPQNATTETVIVPARPVVMTHGQSSYDDAFKSIRTSLDTVKAAMAKAGLKAAGHAITIFSEPDKDGFKYEAAIPIETKPDKVDLPGGVTISESPAGKAIKFQHRGGYDDIDSTYDVITTYLDAKGLQVDNPYIEEYLTDLTTSDDPNLQVDIYVFMK